MQKYAKKTEIQNNYSFFFNFSPVNGHFFSLQCLFLSFFLSFPSTTSILYPVRCIG